MNKARQNKHQRPIPIEKITPASFKPYGWVIAKPPIAAQRAPRFFSDSVLIQLG